LLFAFAQAPCPRYGAVRVWVKACGPLVFSTSFVNLPAMASVSEMVTGYGVDVPAAQLGWQLK